MRRFSHLNYFERKAQREANAAANAAKREARKQAAMHCQCCGRAILANTGTIAHHGYQRPGYCWQTSSCMGAKELPFEVDRAALARMIVLMRSDLARHIEHRAAIAAELEPIVFRYDREIIGPMRALDWRPRSYGGRPKWPLMEAKFNVMRGSFDAFKAGVGRSQAYGADYEDYKGRHLGGLDRGIKNLEEQIALEQGRYDGWKQTHQRVDGQWVKLEGTRT